MTPKPILLVEDNPQDEKLTLRALAKVNLANRVRVARDGQQALDYLLDPAQELPAAVLLDLGLPRISGLDVLTRLRAEPRTRLLPVVILTSSDEEQDRLKSYLGGANSFIRKPVDFTDFVEAVANVGAYWALLNESAATAEPRS
jgi:CheY-like chemotaxis protein